MNQTDQARLSLAVSILQRNTSLHVVSNALKSAGVHYSSGSWDFMRDTRLRNALENGDITFDFLDRLIRDTEEYGRQHIFLYRCPRLIAQSFFERSRVHRAAREIGVEALLSRPKLLEIPTKPTITDIRWDTSQSGNASNFVVKIVQEHKFKSLFDTAFDSYENLETIRYKYFRERSLVVFNLHSDGILEIRASSHRALNYSNVVRDAWNIIGRLLEKASFQEMSLSTAKERLWKERDSLVGKIRYSDSLFRDDLGTIITGATGSAEQDLFDDDAAKRSLDNFVNSNGRCERLNIWFRKAKKEEEPPSSDIHVLLTDKLNEIVITANCQKTDYYHVLGQLRAFNRKVSAR